MSIRNLLVAAFIILIVLSALSPAFRATVERIAILLIMGGVVFWFLTARSPLPRLSRKAAAPDPDVEALLNEIEQQPTVPDQIMLQPSPAGGPTVYTIKVPRNTDWRPERAIALIREFIAIGKLALRVFAQAGEISWQVVDLCEPYVAIDLMATTVRKIYPEAEIVRASAPVVHHWPVYRVGEEFYQLQDFIGPIRYPQTLTDNDPLSIIANLMNDLEPGEFVSYTVFIGETNQEFYQEARKQATRSNWNLGDLGVLASGFRSVGDSFVAAFHIASKAALDNRRDKYRESDMNVIYGKLNDLPLVSAYVLIEAVSPW
jgi:hypothetical protein